jgi:hypothetical protein
LTAGSTAQAPRRRPPGRDASPGAAHPKILIVSWYFPPGNTIGAVRVGKFAKFLHERGCDFRVLTASAWGLPETLPLEVPPERVIATPWTDINELPPRFEALRGWLKRSSAGRAMADPAAGGDGAARPRGRGLGHAYRTLTNVPDRQVGWLPHALSHAARRLDGWRPDLIYASAPPFTSLLVADRLSARYRCPWVIEFRDRWTDDPYYEKPSWRMAIETRWERRLVGRASGIVTVSTPWCDGFRLKYPGKPVATVLNGFDPDDYARDDADPPAAGPLTIVYTGAIYPGAATRRRCSRPCGGSATIPYGRASTARRPSMSCRWRAGAASRTGSRCCRACLIASRSAGRRPPTSCCCCNGTTRSSRATCPPSCSSTSRRAVPSSASAWSTACPPG